MPTLYELPRTEDVPVYLIQAYEEDPVFIGYDRHKTYAWAPPQIPEGADPDDYYVPESNDEYWAIMDPSHTIVYDIVLVEKHWDWECRKPFIRAYPLQGTSGLEERDVYIGEEG